MSRRHAWTDEKNALLLEAAEEEWSGDKMGHGGWARVVQVLGLDLTVAAVSEHYRRLAGKPQHGHGATLPAPVLRCLTEWVDRVGDEKWACAGAQAMVAELDGEHGHKVTVAWLRSWFEKARFFAVDSQLELRNLADEVNQQGLTKEKIATTHKGVHLLLGGTWGYKGIDWHAPGDRWHARFNSGGKQQQYYSTSQLDAALWYSLKKRNQQLEDWEATLLKEVSARSITLQRKEEKAKKQKEKETQTGKRRRL